MLTTLHPAPRHLFTSFPFTLTPVLIFHILILFWGAPSALCPRILSPAHIIVRGRAPQHIFVLCSSAGAPGTLYYARTHITRHVPPARMLSRAPHILPSGTVALSIFCLAAHPAPHVLSHTIYPAVRATATILSSNRHQSSGRKHARLSRAPSIFRAPAPHPKS